MANLDLNSALRGIRGAIDNWVYKRFGNSVLVGRRGVPSGPPTASQLAQRDQFKLAAAYAQAAMADSTMHAFYAGLAKERSQAKGRPIGASAIAIGEYFTAPVITKVDVSAYHGHIGDHIAIGGSANVTAVNVTIRDNAGSTVLEQGAAVFANNQWTYTATTAVPAGHAVSIQARTTDESGVERSLTHAYP